MAYTERDILDGFFLFIRHIANHYDLDEDMRKNSKFLRSDYWIDKAKTPILSNECKHLIGVEYPNRYDGVWEWHCKCYNRTVCRWELKDGKRVKPDELALTKLCAGCRYLKEVK